MKVIYRFLPRLRYPVVVSGCRNAFGVAVSTGTGVCPHSRIAAGRLRSHAAGIAVSVHRSAGCAGVTRAGLAGGTTVRRLAVGRAAGA